MQRQSKAFDTVVEIIIIIAAVSLFSVVLDAFFKILK